MEALRKSQKPMNGLAVSVLFYILIGMMCAFAAYSFVKSPFTGDIQVFMSAANQVQYQPDAGIMGIFESWELKGIGNRILIYMVYRITRHFAEYGSIVRFEEISKCIYGAGGCAVLAISSLLVSSMNNERILFFFFFFLAVFGSFTAVHMQAEMSAVILCIAVFALLVHDRKWSYILAGMIGSLLFFFKSIFFLLFFSAMAGAFVAGRKVDDRAKKYLTSAATFALSELSLIAFVKVFYPQEFKDMGMAAEFQNTLFSRGSAVSLDSILNMFMDNLTHGVVAIPIILIGLVCGLLLIVRFAKLKQWGNIAAAVPLWLLPIDIIVASNMYFVYHYFLLVLPSVISAYVFLNEVRIHRWTLGASTVVAFAACALCTYLMEDNLQTGLVNYSTALLVIIHLLIIAVAAYCVPAMRRYFSIAVVCVLSVSIFFWANYSSALSPKHQNLRALNEISEEIMSSAFPEDFGDEPVLFMDSGAIPFYADAPSYSRYFYNLPMQRWKEGDDWEVQKSEYEKLMAYDGKYIVYQSWFGIDKYPELKEKIDKEYEKMEDRGLYVHAPNWDVFKLVEELDSSQIIRKSGTYILVRKRK